jgi:bifunctional non-homologous end joining protein LigD
MQILEQQKLENVTLYFKEGASDKVYQCAIEPAGERFVVNFQYGRRGSTLNTGTKTNVPVDYDQAKRIFNKLVKEKTGKGYTPGQDGTPYTAPDLSDRFTGILPQLLNPIDEAEMNRLLTNPGYVMQQKFDGRRMLVRKQEEQIHGINKKGLLIGLPETVFKEVCLLPGNFILDGESVGDRFYVFDLLVDNGRDMRPSPYKVRLSALIDLLAHAHHHVLHFAKTAFTAKEKAEMLAELKADEKEGVVFKKLNAAYEPDRPNSGGPQLKHKFYATASCVVARINAQRSVEVRLLGDDGWMVCGNVTIPPNHIIPAVGKVIEVRYLYAIRQSNALHQPVYLGPRSDVDQEECLLTQLKFKPDDEN